MSEKEFWEPFREIRNEDLVVGRRARVRGCAVVFEGAIEISEHDNFVLIDTSAGVKVLLCGYKESPTKNWRISFPVGVVPGMFVSGTTKASGTLLPVWGLVLVGDARLFLETPSGPNYQLSLLEPELSAIPPEKVPTDPVALLRLFKFGSLPKERQA